MGSEVRNRIIGVLLLMIIIFSIGNLIYNIENLDTGGETFIEPYKAPVGAGGGLTSNPALAQTLRYVMIGFMGFGIALLIGSLIYSAKTKDKDTLKSVIYLLIAGALVICLFIFVTAGMNEEQSPLDYNPVLNPDQTDTSGVGDGSGPTYTDPDGLFVGLSFFIFAAFFSFVVIAIFAFGTLVHLRGARSGRIEVEIGTAEVARTIQRAIDDMTKGTDVKATIMRCYRDMCRLASKHGVADQEHLTPREFEAQAGAKLPISDEKLHSLVLIFEEARYSDHLLPEEMRGKALASLESINDELQPVVDGGDEGG